ncbi:hypothetical protein C9426_19280 [Serratia sp. S1B]|nr:hypothetical protein C9426_19280 [Serratia sp. S1B]
MRCPKVNKVKRSLTGLCVGLAFCAFSAQVIAQDNHFDRIVNLPVVENRPTVETANTLRDELLFQRATQAYLWAMPLINTLGMKQGSEAQFGAGYNVMPIWKKRLDAKTLITTPNADVIYAISYLDLGKDGPLVFEAPPQLQGVLMDFWQRPIPVDGGKYFGDVGFPGPDRGKGGKFLLLPPGYQGEVPEGYFVYRSQTNNVLVFLRSMFQDTNNLEPAVKRIESAKIYPLNGKDKVKPMQFPDASGVPVDMLPRSSDVAFNQLKSLLDSEGNHLADNDSLAMLASIGIKKGHDFKPDTHTREILNRAAQSAYKISRSIGFQTHVSGRNFQIYPDRQWINPFSDITPKNPQSDLSLTWHWNDSGILDLDTRIWYFTNYFAVSPGMVTTTPGTGAMFLIGFTDHNKQPLSGGKNYKLTLPANVPVNLFWSVTLYEAENGSMLENGQSFAALSGRADLEKNADGSIDLYFGPKAPKGKERNWIATVPERGWFSVIRLYGPTEAALNRQWKPSDITPIN